MESLLIIDILMIMEITKINFFFQFKLLDLKYKWSILNQNTVLARGMIFSEKYSAFNAQLKFSY